MTTNTKAWQRISKSVRQRVSRQAAIAHGVSRETSRRRLQLEMLECRRLLAVADVYLTQEESAPSAEFQATAVPVASGQLAEGQEDTDLLITLDGSDADGDSLTAEIVVLPREGRLFLTADGTTRGAEITAAGAVVSDPQRRVIFVPGQDEHGTPYDTFDFTLNDGSSDSDPAQVTVTVASVNDAPTVLAPIDIERTNYQGDFTVNLLEGASDVDAGDTLDVTGLTLDSGDASGVTVDGNELRIDISAYSNLGYFDQEVIRYSYSIVDGNGGSTGQTATITITGRGEAPVISGVDPGPLLYRQDNPPLAIAPVAQVTDPENIGFNESQLVVRPVTAPQVGDRWLLQNTSAVTVSGDSVIVDGETIGTHTGGSYTGGAGDSPLVISFNSSATLAAVQATLQATAFVHNGTAPDETTQQQAEIVLLGGGFVDSDPVLVSIDKWDRDEPPQLSDPGASIHYVEDTAPVAIADPTATVSDPDSHGNFGGSKLTTRMARNADSFDRLTIPSTGDGPGEVRVDGTSVLVGGVAVGTVTQNGVATTPLQVVFNNASTADSVTAVLRAMQYHSTQQNVRVASKDVRVELIDPAGLYSRPLYKIVTLEAVNDAAVLSGVTGTTVTYNENALPRTVASTATLSDPDYNGGGSLTVAVTAGGDAGDRLRVLDQGMGSNQIGVIANRIYYSGEQVGTISGGVGTSPLVVTLNSRARVPAVQAMARVVQFSNTSEQPNETSRTLSFSFKDGAGAITPAETATVEVNSINDLPVIAGMGSNLNTTSGGAPIQVAPTVTISDVDSPDFDGGMFRARIASGSTATDLLSIRHVGTGPDQISVSGNEVFWGGLLIGTFSGGSGSTVLQVNLNAAATPLAVQRLARNVMFSTSGAAGDRQVEFQVFDGDGANTDWTGKTISVGPAVSASATPPVESNTKEDETMDAYAASADAVLTNW